jgi:DNA polymerase III alpha subunit
MIDELKRAAPTGKPIIPLHCHTVNSVLDGASTVAEYLDYCVQNNIHSCSCTDHGYVMGHYDLLTLSKKKGVKPIPGCEVYLHPGDDYQGAESKKLMRYFHLTLWARNKKGLQSLWALSNNSWNEGRVVSTFGNLKPRITWKDLEDLSEGLICGTGCMLGPINYPLVRADDCLARNDIPGYRAEEAMAQRNTERLLRIFEGRLFVEIMPVPVNKDYEKDTVSVETIFGERLTFHPDDIIETEYGEMMAREACDRRVSEVLAGRPVRSHKVDLSITSDTFREMEVIDFDAPPVQLTDL